MNKTETTKTEKIRTRIKICQWDIEAAAIKLQKLQNKMRDLERKLEKEMDVKNG